MTDLEALMLGRGGGNIRLGCFLRMENLLTEKSLRIRAEI